MKVLEKILKNLDGYLISIKRNIETGKYELEIGIPINWIFKSNDLVECEVLHESDKGTLAKVKSIKDDVGIDDLVNYVNVIVQTNKSIEKKREEFNKQLEEEKKKLEEDIISFEEEIQSMQEKSFLLINNENDFEEEDEQEEVLKKIKDKVV